MRNVLRWLIFHNLAPRTPWFQGMARRYLYRHNVYGMTLLDLGPNVSKQDVQRFKDWMRDV